MSVNVFSIFLFLFCSVLAFVCLFLLTYLAVFLQFYQSLCDLLSSSTIAYIFPLPLFIFCIVSFKFPPLRVKSLYLRLIYCIQIFGSFQILLYTSNLVHIAKVAKLIFASICHYLCCGRCYFYCLMYYFSQDDIIILTIHSS